MSDLTFEQAMLELEETTKLLENGDVSLNESLTLFEKGIRLTRFCSETLEQAQQKIAVLTEDEAGGRKAKLFSAYKEGETDDDTL